MLYRSKCGILLGILLGCIHISFGDHVDYQPQQIHLAYGGRICVIRLYNLESFVTLNTK